MTQLPSKLKQLGQGMTEYIIIVALIAVAAIGVYSMFGETVRQQMGGMAQDLSGSANTGIGNAQDTASDAIEEADTNKNLGTYDNTYGSGS